MRARVDMHSRMRAYAYRHAQAALGAIARDGDWREALEVGARVLRAGGALTPRSIELLWMVRACVVRACVWLCVCLPPPPPPPGALRRGESMHGRH